MKNRMELKVSFVKTFHKTIDKLFTNVYNPEFDTCKLKKSLQTLYLWGLSGFFDSRRYVLYYYLADS